MKMGIASVIAIIITCYATWYHCNLINQWDESTCQIFFSNLIIIPTATTYIGIKYYFYKHNIKEKLSKVIVIVGSASFGIYLLEQIYRKETLATYNFFYNYMNSFLASFLWICCAFIVGFAVTMIMKQIPGLKKLI